MATAPFRIQRGARIVIASSWSSKDTSPADSGDTARFTPVEVTDEAAVCAVVEIAVNEFRQLDVVFDDGGIIGAVGSIAKLGDADGTVAVMLRSTLLETPGRPDDFQCSGVILLTSSPAGVVGARPSPRLLSGQGGRPWPHSPGRRRVAAASCFASTPSCWAPP